MPADGSISLVLGHLCKPACKDYLVPSIPAALESEAEEQSEPDRARQKPLSKSTGSSCAPQLGWQRKHVPPAHTGSLPLSL